MFFLTFLQSFSFQKKNSFNYLLHRKKIGLRMRNSFVFGAPPFPSCERKESVERSRRFQKSVDRKVVALALERLLSAASELDVSRNSDRILIRSVKDQLPLPEQPLSGSEGPLLSHVQHLQGPGSLRSFPPEVDGQKGPLVEGVGQGVALAREKEVWLGAGRRCEHDHDVSSGIKPERDLALDVFEVPDRVEGSVASVGLDGDASRDSDAVRDWSVGDHDVRLADVLGR